MISTFFATMETPATTKEGGYYGDFSGGSCGTEAFATPPG